jgi:CheY-like chemotaxis protein
MIDSPLRRDIEAGSTRRTTRARRVLIVEDDPINARVLADFLTAHGYETSIADNGPEGIAKCEALRPDVMVIDVLLPRKNGFEVCFAIRHTEHGKHVPVLLMSAAYRDRVHAEQMRVALSAEGFLLKPFDLDALLEHLRRLFGGV